MKALILIGIAFACSSSLWAEARLLLPEGTGPSAALAADEFRKYWREVCGREIPVDRADDGRSDYVAVGVAEPGMTFDPVHDTYYMRSVRHGGRTRLALVGGNARANFYAVYDFFERRCGCRWFWDGDVVPRRPEIDITGLDVCERSRFEFRATHYFAHRGLTRFQATHWGPADWEREIDLCLKNRLNFIMLQIGTDDLFQRAFPDVVPYPDPSVSQPPERPGRPGYDNHSPHWSLEYRGRLRKRVIDYARARGLMHPAEFGTLTHWFSRTPQAFLDKMKPPFLPQANASYVEPSGLLWDIRQQKWFDMYWKLTEAQLKNWCSSEYLFTPGFDERQMYEDRDRNLQFKSDVVLRYLDYAHARHPESRLLVEGWDFHNAWTASEVREFVSRLDPRTTVIWDYEADGTQKYNSGFERGNNFTEWGVVGKFPYVFGMLLGLQRGSDIRLDYDIVTVRQRIIRDDPFCVGYSLWPETSHSDIFAWRYFAKNCWNLSDRSVPELLHEFCVDRYGEASAAFESAWGKVIPMSTIANWWDIYAFEVTVDLRYYWTKERWINERVFPAALKKCPQAFRELAKLPRATAFADRDAIDLARTMGDRLIVASGRELAKRYYRLKRGESTLPELRRYAEAYVKAGEAMARVLALHPDYSLTESLDRLATIEPVPNPDFEHVLFENASCLYCRSHQAEFAAHWYVDDMRDLVRDLLAAAERGGKETLPRDGRDRMAELAKLPHPIRSQALDFPRTDENYVRTMNDFAEAADVLTSGLESLK